MNLLVTGGAGFIGSNLLHQIIDQPIIERLDHLAWLGVDAIWLSPTMPSPDEDWGYDVSDYTGVHPELGTLADLDELIEQAGQRGMRVLLDLVPNHTSSAHPWFADAASGRGAAPSEGEVASGTTAIASVPMRQVPAG